MKKFYAKQVPAENTDYNDYLDEEVLKDEQIFIGLNREFISLNQDLYDDTLKALEGIYDDLEATDTFEDTGAERRIVEDYIIGELSDDDVKAVVKAAYDYVDNNDINAICTTLSIANKREFTHCTLRGCSQGDWVKCIYPTDFSSLLNYYEAVFFGTGSEWMITPTAIESADDFDDSGYFFDYTDKWRDEDIKTWVAEGTGCSPEDVVLLKISGSHTYTKYDYEAC